MKELTHQATDLIYGGEDLGPDSIKLSVQRTLSELSRITSALEKGEYDFDGTVEERVSAGTLCLPKQILWYGESFRSFLHFEEQI